jgi:DNA-directed RNA polymerase subunit D
VFHVETDGSFATDELLVRAVDTLRDRATELKDAVQL